MVVFIIPNDFVNNLDNHNSLLTIAAYIGGDTKNKLVVGPNPFGTFLGETSGSKGVVSEASCRPMGASRCRRSRAKCSRPGILDLLLLWGASITRWGVGVP